MFFCFMRLGWRGRCARVAIVTRPPPPSPSHPAVDEQWKRLCLLPTDWIEYLRSVRFKGGRPSTASDHPPPMSTHNYSSSPNEKQKEMGRMWWFRRAYMTLLNCKNFLPPCFGRTPTAVACIRDNIVATILCNAIRFFCFSLFSFLSVRQPSLISSN